MAEILISNRTWNKPQFKQMCGESLDEMQCSGSGGVMWPYEPYTVGQTTDMEARILRALYCGSPQNIHKLSAAAGQDNIVGISEAMAKLREDMPAALTGAASTVHTRLW